MAIDKHPSAHTWREKAILHRSRADSFEKAGDRIGATESAALAEQCDKYADELEKEYAEGN